VDVIVGLGGAGCSIADQFSNYNEYDVYQLDNVDRKEKNYYRLPTHGSHEDYERKLEGLEKFFEKIFGDCLFVVSGASDVSGASLVILEKISQRCDINILYIKTRSSTGNFKTSSLTIFNNLPAMCPDSYLNFDLAFLYSVNFRML